MSQSNVMTDRAALLRQRVRSGGRVRFLHDSAVADVEDRLAMVNKSFTDVGIVSGHSDIWAATEIGRNAELIADTNTLRFTRDTYDLVIHAMCLHWADDPVGQLIQMRRVLRPDGLMLAIFPAGQTLQELRACLAQAETDIRGGLSPRVLPMGDIRDLGALLQRAGYALPVADSQLLTAEYGSLTALLHDLRGMGETNALAQRSRAALRRDVLARADALYGETFTGEQKAIRASYELISLTGWAPSASQPQPLRPGSAATRLADALGTVETRLPD